MCFIYIYIYYTPPPTQLAANIYVFCVSGSGQEWLVPYRPWNHYRMIPPFCKLPIPKSKPLQSPVNPKLFIYPQDFYFLMCIHWLNQYCIISIIIWKSKTVAIARSLRGARNCWIEWSRGDLFRTATLFCMIL